MNQANQVAPYDVLPFSDQNGKLYLGNLRSASYYWDGPGRSVITLEGSEPSGKHFAHNGTCDQIDVAESICVIWVEEGRIAAGFRKAE